MRDTGARLAQAMAALFFPQQNICHLCGRALAAHGEGLLCERCMAALSLGRIAANEQAVGLHEPLSVCLSAWWHQNEARELVHQLKYRGDRALAQPLAEGMTAAYAQTSESSVRRAQLLIPVPLHPFRLRRRGYNQSLLLAEEIAAHTGLALCSDALCRVRATRPQVGATRETRLGAMRGAFAAQPVPSLRGAHVLLVDDVLTTGATAIACAEALLDVGVAEVSLLTACRA